MVQATVYAVNQQRGSIYEELELRLRSAISAGSNSGYEINFRCVHNGTQYTEIVRWNGPRGDFTYLARAIGPGLFNGDVVTATVVGNVITAYINGVQVNQATDDTYASGNPGIGFYLDRAPNLNGDFGFTNFTALDIVTLPGDSGRIGLAGGAWRRLPRMSRDLRPVFYAHPRPSSGRAQTRKSVSR